MRPTAMLRQLSTFTQTNKSPLTVITPSLIAFLFRRTIPMGFLMWIFGMFLANCVTSFPRCWGSPAARGGGGQSGHCLASTTDFSCRGTKDANKQITMISLKLPRCSSFSTNFSHSLHKTRHGNTDTKVKFSTGNWRTFELGLGAEFSVVLCSHAKFTRQ